MESDFDITIEGGEDINDRPVQLPINFITIGEVAPDDAKVYIKQDVYKRLEAYSEADTENERGTILVGEYSDDLGNMSIVISDFIEARYTDASASTLTFTHETWDYVHKVKDKAFPEKLIVGWQHTHPGYGIFLSNYDMFIQENFFNMPFQVAYVIDPVQHLRGFFQWKSGKIEKLKGYIIYDDLGKKIEVVDKKKLEKEASNSSSISWKKVLFPVVLLFLIACLACASWTAIKSRKEVAEILKQMETLNDNLASQQDEITALKEAKNEGVSQLEEEQESETPSVEDSKKDSSTEFISYKIKAGDSLESICASHGIDFETWHQTLCGLNGFSNPNLIYEGQTILLPIIKSN